MRELTKLEKLMLTTYISHLDKDEPTYSNMDADDLAYLTKIDIKILRGVIGSLIKKDYIYILNVGCGDFIYLKEKHYNLIN